MHSMEPDPEVRREVHNAAVDEDVANAQLCGLTDLRTGRTCKESAHHSGSCLFVAKELAPVHAGVMSTEEK